MESTGGIVDVWHESLQPASVPAPSGKKTEKGQALAREAALAARMAAMRVDDPEAARAAMWRGLRLPVRRVAVMAAGMHRARAEDALNRFNAFERGQIWIEVEKLIADLGELKKCMQGGEVKLAGGGSVEFIC